LNYEENLRVNFHLINNILSEDNKADIYATITLELVKLTYHYDRFANTPNYMIYKKWAIEAIYNGHSSMLIEQLNQIIEEKDFLPDQDYLCHAFGPDDSNDHKYARISLLESKIGNDIKILSDIPTQGSLDNNFHIAWAKFHSVDEMREEIINKFQQIINKHQYKEDIAKSFVQVIEAILELSYHNNNNTFDHSSIYEWVLLNLKDNKQEYLLTTLAKYVNDKKFLISIPSIDTSF
jgi:hypothetical protein